MVAGMNKLFTFALLLPVLLCTLVFSAHMMRNEMPLIALLIACSTGFLMLKKRWVPRLFRIVLLLAALEWMRTAVSLAMDRMSFGQPWLRMVFILGSVALLTLLSARVFRSTTLKNRYEGSVSEPPAVQAESQPD